MRGQTEASACRCAPGYIAIQSGEAITCEKNATVSNKGGRVSKKKVAEACGHNIDCESGTCDTAGVFQCKGKCVVAQSDSNKNASFNCPSAASIENATFQPKRVGEACTTSLECASKACDEDGLFKCWGKCVKEDRDPSRGSDWNCPPSPELDRKTKLAKQMHAREDLLAQNVTNSKRVEEKIAAEGDPQGVLANGRR